MTLPPAERRCRKLAKHAGLVFYSSRHITTMETTVRGEVVFKTGWCQVQLPDGTMILDADTPEALEDLLLEWVQR